MPTLEPSLSKHILKGDYEAIVFIHDTIMQSLNQPMPTIETLANTVSMSSTKFRLLFKKIYGCSIYQYHLRARLNLAQKLLLENELTATQIGYRVGFSHPSSFVNCFFKQFGTYPVEFKKRAATQS